MRAIVFFFAICLSQTLLSQTRKLYAEFTVPFNFGIAYIKGTQNESPASFLQNNTKKNSGMWQPIKLELVWKEQLSAILQYKVISFNSKNERVLSDLADQNPTYFIQHQSKHENSMSPAPWATRFELVQYGLGYQKKIGDNHYLQFAGYLNSGTATLDSIDFSMKPLSSNDYFIREYKFDDAKCKGFSTQVAYKIVAETENSANQKPVYFIASAGLEYFHWKSTSRGSFNDFYPETNEYSSRQFITTRTFNGIQLFASIGVCIARNKRTTQKD
ncbi:MAG: hypothetical protein RLZZ77_2258 [Bacteroidota bacterium]|jgi:hypothetical protein